MPFGATLLVGDVCDATLLRKLPLPPQLRFGLASCQFAMHYAFRTEARARAFLQNASSRFAQSPRLHSTQFNSRGHLHQLWPSSPAVGAVRYRRLHPGGIFVATVPDAAVLVARLRAASGTEFGNSLYRVVFAAAHANKVFPSSRPFGIAYTFELKEVALSSL